MRFFVREDSIVRKIWGKGDTILFIFAGASAEFALNKAVDWLYLLGGYRQIRWDDYSLLFHMPAVLFFQNTKKRYKPLKKSIKFIKL